MVLVIFLPVFQWSRLFHRVIVRLIKPPFHLLFVFQLEIKRDGGRLPVHHTVQLFDESPALFENSALVFLVEC